MWVADFNFTNQRWDGLKVLHGKSRGQREFSSRICQRRYVSLCNSSNKNKFLPAAPNLEENKGQLFIREDLRWFSCNFWLLVQICATVLYLHYALGVGGNPFPYFFSFFSLNLSMGVKRADGNDTKDLKSDVIHIVKGHIFVSHVQVASRKDESETPMLKEKCGTKAYNKLFLMV
jgi:hypothetical protein